MRRYRWGMFQGWVLIVFGAFGLLIGGSPLLLKMFGIIGSAIQLGAGVGIITKYKNGLIAYYVCVGMILVSFLFHAPYMDPIAFVISAPLLCWWVLPAALYYPKRWSELSVGKANVIARPVDRLDTRR